VPDADRLLPLIVYCSREAVLKRYRPDSCIATTRVIVDVARHYGITVVPQPVSVCAFNAKGAELLQASVPLEQWPDDAHSVGVTGVGPSNPGTWNGHLIGLTDTHMLDGALDQMSRPAKGLCLAPLTARLPPEGWAEDTGVKLEEAGILLLYGRLDNQEYRTSRNWSRRDPNVRHVTSRAIEEVRRAYRGD
jgi:hypothetical protein